MKITLSETIRQAIDYYMAHIHTCLPGEIHTYDAKTQKAAVKPLIRQVFYNGKTISMPIVVNVPVIFPRSGKSGIKFPIATGDKVLLLFAESSMERWLSSGNEVDPGVNRRFDMSDGIAIPGLYPVSGNQFGADDEQEDFILVHQNSKIKIKKDDTIKLDNQKASVEIQPDGKVVIKCTTIEFSNNEESLLSILSDTLQAISEITVDSHPIDNIATFNDLKTRLEKLI